MKRYLKTLPFFFLLLLLFFLLLVSEHPGVPGRVRLLGPDERALVGERAKPAQQLPVRVLRILLKQGRHSRLGKHNRKLKMAI